MAARGLVCDAGWLSDAACILPLCAAQAALGGRSSVTAPCGAPTAPHCWVQDGAHYHFTTKEAFEAEIAEGKFLEYAYVHNNIYGTSIQAVRDVAEAGKCCILDIDVQGARQVRPVGCCGGVGL